MNLFGPINSGAAAGSAGSATANATSTIMISGEVKAVYVKYNDSPPAGTTDVTVATQGTVGPAAVTILSITDAATSAWFYPRVQAQTTAGAGITYDGTNEVYECIPVHDFVKVTIAGANAADNVDVWLMVE